MGAALVFANFQLISFDKLKLLAAQPWVRRWYSTSETAEALSLDYDTALAMIAGGVIRAERESERAQWRVSVSEVARWKRILVTP